MNSGADTLEARRAPSQPPALDAAPSGGSVGHRSERRGVEFLRRRPGVPGAGGLEHPTRITGHAARRLLERLIAKTYVREPAS